MTCLNLIVDDAGAHIFTDGMVYDIEANKVNGFASKPLQIPHLNAVIAASGYLYVNYLLTAAIADANPKSFDELKKGLEQIVRKAHREATGLPEAVRDWGFFEVVLAGWSESADQPEGYVMQRHGIALTEARRVQRQFLSPWDHDDRMPENSGDVSAFGLSIVERQRELRVRPRGRDLETHAVGGFCQQTTVTRDGIETRILKRWPDQVGRPLELAPAESLF